MVNYYLLTKPGIILGNLMTMATGFFLATHGIGNFFLFFTTLLGLCLVIASACVFNNYIDQGIDQKMKRTKNRVLVKKLIPKINVIYFASFLGLCGVFILFFYTNILTTAIAGFGFFVYVVLYSMWKVHTVYGTAIGSIAGAIPPVVGYCSVSNQIDMAITILFFVLVFWQMPHFFSIALIHFEDYKVASIPVLPVKKGIFRTKLHMLFYIIFFSVTASLLTIFNYTGRFYLFASIFLGFFWFFLCLRGFKNVNDKLWAKHMFRLSLIIITVLSIAISFDIR